MENTIDPQTTAGTAKAKPEVIKLGLDLHARQVTECRQLDGSTPKPPQQWEPKKLLAQVETWVKAGIKVYSCYEAGACGYWFHRELVKRGVVNFVVAPRPLGPYRTKGQKTDRLDARGLLDQLDSYLRGNRQAMSLVAVPSPELEQQRSVVRHREQLMRHRRRAEAQGRALALTQGIIAPVGWWRPLVWAEFEPQLPAWLKPQLAYWQQTALALASQERQVRRQLEQMVTQELPVGVGALSWITLELELRGSRPLPESPASG
jgi:transposase